MATVLQPASALSSNNQTIDFEVVTCFIKHKNEYLVLQRGRKDAQFGLWGIPGGKLDQGEAPEKGLSREIFEETGIIISEESFQLLNKAHSVNPFDGSYLLYLYFVELKRKPKILINSDEHLNYKWVDMNNFEKLELLVSQGPAFRFIKNKLIRIEKKEKIVDGKKM